MSAKPVRTYPIIEGINIIVPLIYQVVSLNVPVVSSYPSITDNIVQFATIATIAIAGGVAGQCQYVASYMSERWLGLVIDETTHAATTRPTTASTMKAPLSSTLFHNLSSSSSSSSNISLRRHRNFITSFYSTVPTVRSIVLSFPSSAIGFLAYEYGKLMME